MAVTVERFNALCDPLSRRISCNIAMTTRVLAALWVIAFSITIPFIVITVLEDATFYDGSPIKVCRTKIDTTWKQAYIVLLVIGFFAIPFFILLVIYSKIIKKLMCEKLQSTAKNTPSAMHAYRTRKQVVYMLIILIILFFITLSPMRIVTMLVIFAPSESIQNLGLEGYLNLMSWSRVLMYVNSAGNPVIYNFVSTKFQLAFRRLLHRQNGRSVISYQTTPQDARRPRADNRCKFVFVQHAKGNDNMKNGQGKTGTNQQNRRTEFLLAEPLIIKIHGKRLDPEKYS